MQPRRASSPDKPAAATGAAAIKPFRDLASGAAKQHARGVRPGSPGPPVVGSVPDGDNPYDGPYLGRRAPPQTSEDPNGIKDLVTDVVGDYTKREIDAVIDLQKRMDEFSYEPRDSDGGRKPDDGSDSLFAFQSNLQPIKRILATRYQAGPDDDADDSVINDRLRRLELMQEDADNNQLAHHERDLSQQMRSVLEQLSNSEHDNDFFVTLGDTACQEVLAVREAPEPETLIWENLAYSHRGAACTYDVSSEALARTG